MRRRMCYALLVLFLTGIGLNNYAQTASSNARTQDGKLLGSAVDTGGGLISRAYVLIHRHDTTLEMDSVTKVDVKGMFDFSLQPGLYDVMIASNGFVPLSRKIEIVSGKETEFKAVLSPDVEHMNLDRF